MDDFGQYAARFWSKARQADNGCWEWLAYKNADGYGAVGNFRHPGSSRAHRVAWRLARGRIADGLHVLHKCDNRACVNPDHLYLGTHRDNMRDRAERGRSRGGKLPGELAPHAKLKETDAITIRALVGAGYLQKDCAVLWGVTKATVNDLVLRKTWRHV
jgi:hypothetical protein